MKKYNIAQIGTFDYENFGDLLFPEVLYNNLSKYIEIDNHFLFSPVGGKMPFYEDKYVYPISELENIHLKYHIDAIIIGGGDTIRMDKSVVNSNEYSVEDAPSLLWVLPSIIAVKYNIKLIWNCNGVPFSFLNSQHNLVNSILELTDYISVRDIASCNFLKECNNDLDIKIYPDSVCLIRSCIDNSIVKDIFNSIADEYTCIRKKYIIFQANAIGNDVDFRNCIDELLKIKDNLKYEIVLMPIGYIHNDLKTLHSYSTAGNGEFCLIERKLSPHEMIALISNAYCFIGTSLHGSVVSYSFGVPSIAYDMNHLTKINGLYKIIGKSENIVHNPSCLYSTVCRLLDNEYKTDEQVFSSVKQNFANIADLITSKANNNQDKAFLLHKSIADLWCSDKINNHMCRVYYKYNNEFTELGFTAYEYIENSINVSFHILSGVNSIRFDPCEGFKCFLKNVTFLVNGTKIQPCEYNGVSILDNYYFDSEDPWLVYSDFNDGDNIDIIAEIITDEEQIAHELLYFINNDKLNIKDLKEENNLIRRDNDSLERRLIQSQEQYNSVINSRWWRCTSIFRKLTGALRKITPLRYFAKTLLLTRRKGIKYTVKAINHKLFYNEYKVSQKQLKIERNTKFNNNIKFSILVPLYNTPEKFLKEMIRSVIKQTYSDWELCLADGSDNKHSYVEKMCNSLAQNDARIKYKRLEKNLGISENTNECIRMSTGNYIALFDHDDILHPSALYNIMKAIEDKDADFIYTDEASFTKTTKKCILINYKSDFAIDTLRSYNYICHLSCFKRDLIEQVGYFRSICDGSQDYDMILRLTEKAKCIYHIPKVLYFWRIHPNSVAQDISAKMYTIDAAKKALSDHLTRVGLDGIVKDSKFLSTYKIEYKLTSNPLISIIIANKDSKDDLEKCIISIFNKTTYKNFEIIIVENNSTTKEIFSYYEYLKSNYSNVQIVTWKDKFNYSAINNFGVRYAKGEQLLLLNNDTEVITPDWMEEMLMFSQREDVGAVGAMLYYPDDTVQHAGVIVGLGGVAGHAHKYFKRGDPGYAYKLSIVQDLSCVTAACIMIPRNVFEKINGFDESYQVAFNDVDLCMHIRQLGYNVVWTPYAELYHYESKSRGAEDTPEKIKRFQGETKRFQKSWIKELKAGDPYYNPNLTLDREDYSAK